MARAGAADEPGLVGVCFGSCVTPDVVHCHQRHVLTSTLSAMYCRATGRRVFATELGGGGWDISAYVSTDRWYHGHLHISEYSVKIHGHAGHPWAHLISGGVDTERFAPDDTVPRNGSVVFVGRLLPHKGLVDLLDATGSDVAVEIIGQPCDPVFLNELKRRADGSTDPVSTRLRRSRACTRLSACSVRRAPERLRCPWRREDTGSGVVGAGAP